MSDTQPIEGITPLPWEVYQPEPADYPGIEAHEFSVIVWGDPTDDTGVRGETLQQAKANARYIVLAANTYPAHLARIERLEAALRGVLKAWDRIGLCTECAGVGVVDSGGVTQWDQPINVPCGCSVFSEARAALAESEVADGR